MFVKRKRAAKRLMDVTWEEIEEARRHGDRTMEFELYDIFEEASIYGRDLERAIEENIKYVLEREGLYNPRKMGGIVIPAGALNWECDENGFCWFTADFEVFDKTGNKIIAWGTVHGHMTMIDEEEGRVELTDMTVSMPTSHVAKLKQIVEGLARAIATVFKPR